MQISCVEYKREASYCTHGVLVWGDRCGQKIYHGSSAAKQTPVSLLSALFLHIFNTPKAILRQ